jgi:PKD repeat protein
MKVAPDGRFYGDAAEFVANKADTNFAYLEAGETATIVTKAPRDSYFDWGSAVSTTGPDVPVVLPPTDADRPKTDSGGPYSATAGVPVVLSAGGTILSGDSLALVTWDLDGDGEFDDAQGRNPQVTFAAPGTIRIRVRVTPESGAAATSEPSDVLVEPAPPLVIEVDPGAEGSPVVPIPAPVDLRVEIPAGQSTAVRLGPDDGPLLPWVVVGFDPGTVTVRSGEGATPGAGLPTTGSTGTVEVTPAEGLRGTTTLTYAYPDDLTRTATVEVVVVGNAPPAAGDDTLTVDVGVTTVVPAAQLLANDSDPDDGLPLRLVQVSGMTAGQAWLTADADQVVIVADRVGAAQFGYVVADRDGGIGQGRVAVTVRGSDPMEPGGGGTTPPSGPPVVTPPQVPPDLATAVMARTRGKVHFAYKSAKLSRPAKRKLGRLVSRMPDGASVVLTRSVGFVRAKNARRADHRLALHRAKVVRKYLIGKGLGGTITASNAGRTGGRTAKARRVNVTITYTIRS